jgi:pyruvate-ferredoxin/flavodoxin oxidoreductase
VHDPELLERRDVFAAAMPGAKVLLNTEVPADRVWETLPEHVRAHLLARGIRLFVIDASKVAEEAGLGRRINTVMQACYFAASAVLPEDEALALQVGAIERTWGRRGDEVVRRNVRAIEGAARLLTEVEVPGELGPARPRMPTVPDDAPAFVRNVTRALLEGRGDDLPVSAFTVDGTWPTGTSRYEKRALARDIPVWQPDLCVQCNFCSMVCPHAAIRTKVFAPEHAEGAPAGFRSVPETFEAAFSGQRYAVQVAPEDCTGCGLCIEVCPAKDRKHAQTQEGARLRAARCPRREDRPRRVRLLRDDRVGLPRWGRRSTNAARPFACRSLSSRGPAPGCGETPYIRLLTQLYGDRLLDGQRHRLLVDLRRQPADDAVHRSTHTAAARRGSTRFSRTMPR